MYKIHVLNNLSSAGLSRLDPKKYKLVENIKDPDAILVRSFNMHDMPLPESVKVVGRAGVGTNNIPVQQLTMLGIPVLNTPGANANAVKELVITGMLLASRNICSAWDYTRQIEGDDDALNQHNNDGHVCYARALFFRRGFHKILFARDSDRSFLRHIFFNFYSERPFGYLESMGRAQGLTRF